MNVIHQVILEFGHIYTTSLKGAAACRLEQGENMPWVAVDDKFNLGSNDHPPLTLYKAIPTSYHGN